MLVLLLALLPRLNDKHQGLVAATDPVLTVLLGDAVIWQGQMSKGKAKVAVAKPPSGRRYACVATMAGMMAFYTKFCDIGIEKKYELALSPVMKPGESRLVLTWAAKPKDLDIYVLAPHSNPAQPPCEVNWRQKNCHSGSVRLDRDDTNGHGPETISIFDFNPGKYIVRIDEYRGNPRAPLWAVSEATVAYYAPHCGGIFNFVDQTGYIEGRVWYVIAIDGTTRMPSACTRELCPVRPQPRNDEIGPPPELSQASTGAGHQGDQGDQRVAASAELGEVDGDTDGWDDADDADDTDDEEEEEEEHSQSGRL